MMMIRTRPIARLVVAGILFGTTLFVTAEAAPARPRCTLKGTAADDRLIDTAGASVICARGGNDLVEGGTGADRVFGGKGNDQLEGNDGNDVVAGEQGADTLVLVDGVSGNDRAIGGPGQDTCYLDRGDKSKGCETKNIVG